MGGNFIDGFGLWRGGIAWEFLVSILFDSPILIESTVGHLHKIKSLSGAFCIQRRKKGYDSSEIVVRDECGYGCMIL